LRPQGVGLGRIACVQAHIMAILAASRHGHGGAPGASANDRDAHAQ
jgi:hypothetical protein